ncbi:MAG TPA: oxygenase MpaB family protein, partial [Jatrophihabitantaceae bacterium]|nr:oxygenase MpaB family protein [Jatrophihabitantaceae bacterium]
LIYGFSRVLGPFTRAEQEQLYAESRRWYRLYGMTMRNVPETLDEFDAYWEHYVEDVLEATPSAQWLLATFRKPPPPPGFERIPAPIWRIVRRPVGHAAVVYASGLLPSAARDKLGLRWGPRQRVQYRIIRRALRASVPLTPMRYRYHPRPLAGWRREAADRHVSVRALAHR